MTATALQPVTPRPVHRRHAHRAGGILRALPTPASPGDRPCLAPCRAATAVDESATASQLAAARRAARPLLPDPALVVRRVAMALLEVEAGCRSAEQLERRCHPDLWERVNQRLRRRGGAFVTGGSLVRVHCQEHAPGLADGVAVVRRGGRIGAVAMRLDAGAGRWMVSDLCF